MTLVEVHDAGGNSQTAAGKQTQVNLWPAAGPGELNPVPPARKPVSAHDARARMLRYLANQCTEPLPQESTSFARARRRDMPMPATISRPAAPQT